MATTTDIDYLKETMQAIQKNNADLKSRIGELDQTLASFREELIHNQKKMATLTQKLDESQARMGSKMDQMTQLLSTASVQPSVPLPSEEYRTAYGDYLSGKMDLAIQGFKSFAERYPKSDLLDDAEFYLGDSYLIKKDFAQARVHFDKVLSISEELRAHALLKRAYSLEGMKQTENQKKTLEALVQEFPDSAEAQTAKEILKEVARKSPQPKPSKRESAQNNHRKKSRVER
ncbi:MAG: tetratricopeptide repeat protein [Elusimicrobia bacterium]|nr:tetratricopeptide repeat protein [Elusimicrobiota bacterium]MBI3013186.1 tetratricopeptide repeat protein [Elusimicrobiota bacterium]